MRAIRWIVAIAASFAALAAARYACAHAAHLADSTSWAIAGAASAATLTIAAWWAARDPVPVPSGPTAHASGGNSQAITGPSTLAIGPHATLTNTTIHLNSDPQPRPLTPLPAPVTVVVGDVPQQPPAFQPRTALLDPLYGHTSGPAIAEVYALAGMRGCGKTHAAAAYARQRIIDRWRLVAWINADTPATILNGLTNAATALGIPAGTTLHDTALSLRHYLETSGHHCLLVFDNAPGPAALRPYLPATGDTHILITSTNTASLGTPIPIDVYTPAEALTYLRERTHITDDDLGAQELSDELGRLPLALAQGAALIASQHLDYPTYLHRLLTFPLADYLTTTSEDPYPHHTAAAILLAVTTATATDPTGLALPLLNLISLLSPTGVTRDLLHTAHATGALTTTHPARRPRRRTKHIADRATAAARVDAAVAHLATASLISYSLDRTSITAHRLTTRALREHAAHNRTLPAAVTTVTTLLDAATRATEPVWQHRPAAAALIRHVTALHHHLTHLPHHSPTPDTTALLGLRGWAQRSLIELADNPAQAIALGQTVAADHERILGPAHAHTLAARNDLARAYHAAGRLAEAIALQERNLSDREHILGSDHADTLRTRNNLANAYSEAGRVAEATTLYQRTLTDAEHLFGRDHPRARDARDALAALRHTGT